MPGAPILPSTIYIAGADSAGIGTGDVTTAPFSGQYPQGNAAWVNNGYFAPEPVPPQVDTTNPLNNIYPRTYQASSADAFSGFMGDPYHRMGIVNPISTMVGVGVASTPVGPGAGGMTLSTTYLVEFFGYSSSDTSAQARQQNADNVWGSANDTNVPNTTVGSLPYQGKLYYATGSPSFNQLSVGDQGYRIMTQNGQVYNFGNALSYQNPFGSSFNDPNPQGVGIASYPNGQGYWVASNQVGNDPQNPSANEIFGADGLGVALGYSTGSTFVANKPIVGVAANPDGKGYWLVASDGGVFSYGFSQFYGSTGAMTLNKPIVGMAATPDGKGYWLVASDGGIFSFGDAQFYGSTGNIHLNKPIVGMAATPDGKGYWMVASDGGIFSFGDAQFLGSLGNVNLSTPVVGIAATSM
jgi:hypothetical protein